MVTFVGWLVIAWLLFFFTETVYGHSNPICDIISWLQAVIIISAFSGFK